MEKLYTNICGSIYFLESHNALYMELEGKLSNEPYREIFAQLMHFAIEKGIDASIADQRKVITSSLESRAWMLLTWLPDFKKALQGKIMPIVGISEAKYGVKKVIAEYVRKSAERSTGFPVYAVATFEEAIAIVEKTRKIPN